MLASANRCGRYSRALVCLSRTKIHCSSNIDDPHGRGSLAGLYPYLPESLPARIARVAHAGFHPDPDQKMCRAARGRCESGMLTLQHTYLVEGGGFEPPKAEPTDLQSAPFDRSGTPPNTQAEYCA